MTRVRVRRTGAVGVVVAEKCERTPIYRGGQIPPGLFPWAPLSNPDGKTGLVGFAKGRHSVLVRLDDGTEIECHLNDLEPEAGNTPSREK